MMEAFYIDENGTRQMLEIPDNAANLTESLNSSRTVRLLLKQHEEQCKQNKRLFWISIITSLISAGALIVSIIALIG
mgnify:FL=1